MNRTTLRSSIITLALAATTAIPAGSALAASASTTHKYSGSIAAMDRYGEVQVTISVKNKKITSVAVAANPQEARSVFIESQAFPLLKQEVLRAQSANINLVSGATDTSNGFVQSLQSAISKARHAKMLK